MPTPTPSAADAGGAFDPTKPDEIESHSAWLARQPVAPVLPPLTFTYRNYRGEVAERRVRPISTRYGTTDWHPEPGWLLRAFDLDKGAEREFAMADIGAPAGVEAPQPVADLPGIWTDPARCGGRPCLYGRRFTIAQLLAEVAQHGVASTIDHYDMPADVVAKALDSVSVNFDRMYLAAFSHPPVASATHDAGQLQAFCHGLMLILGYGHASDKASWQSFIPQAEQILALHERVFGAAGRAGTTEVSEAEVEAAWRDTLFASKADVRRVLEHVARVRPSAPTGSYREGMLRAAQIVEEHGASLDKAGRGDEACAFSDLADVIRTMAATRAEAPTPPQSTSPDAGGQHDTYISDSSLYDERCRICGRTDGGISGPNRLLEPCPGAPDAGGRDGAEGSRVGEDEALLAALLKYTGEFYGVAISAGIPAGKAAQAVAHVEKAARRLHALARLGATRPSPDAGGDVGTRIAADTLTSLRQANTARHVEWAASKKISLSWRGNELAGECGEACNVLKKLDRERMGLVGSRATTAQLAEELADVVICADLAAMDCGIDLGAAVIAKFNATSEARGLVTRIGSAGSVALVDVAAERRRQVEDEGWTPEHDDAHENAEMGVAALCYVQAAVCALGKPYGPLRGIPSFWPWEDAWWKPADPRRNLVKAGALIIAEIERLDRTAARTPSPSPTRPATVGEAAS